MGFFPLKIVNYTGYIKIFFHKEWTWHFPKLKDSSTGGIIYQEKKLNKLKIYICLNFWDVTIYKSYTSATQNKWYTSYQLMSFLFHIIIYNTM